jgi:CO dehydrogenase nickel-insertion accessory protein CooC1
MSRPHITMDDKASIEHVERGTKNSHLSVSTVEFNTDPSPSSLLLSRRVPSNHGPARASTFMVSKRAI